MEELIEENKIVKMKSHIFKCDICDKVIGMREEDPKTGVYLIPEENIFYFSTKSTYNNKYEFTRYQRMYLCNKCKKEKEDQIDNAIQSLGFKHVNRVKY